MTDRKLLLVVLGCAVAFVAASPLESETVSAICSQPGIWIAPSALPCFALANLDDVAPVSETAIASAVLPTETQAVGASPASQPIPVLQPAIAHTNAQNRLAPIQQPWALHTILPDAPSSSYFPLSSRAKFDLFLAQSTSPETFLGTTFDAGWAQLTNDWPGYGQGMQGFGKRWGALMADRQAKSFLGSFLLPTLLHQDPRYFRMGKSQPMWKRIGYALSRLGITRNDNGDDTFNSSLVLSTLAATSLSNAYYPKQQRGLSRTMTRFGGSLLGSAQTCVIHEFLPDMMHLFQKHAPEKLIRLDRKLLFLRKLDPEDFPGPAEK